MEPFPSSATLFLPFPPSSFFGTSRWVPAIKRLCVFCLGSDLFPPRALLQGPFTGAEPRPQTQRTPTLGTLLPSPSRHALSSLVVVYQFYVPSSPYGDPRCQSQLPRTVVNASSTLTMSEYLHREEAAPKRLPQTFHNPRPLNKQAVLHTSLQYPWGSTNLLDTLRRVKRGKTWQT